MSQWVQHISRQGEKWKVHDVCWQTQWEVERGQGESGFYYLPKSEYILCAPPERWVDVTAECEITNTGLVRHLHPDEPHTYPSVTSGYRFLKVLLTRHNTQQNQWAFVVERREGNDV